MTMSGKYSAIRRRVIVSCMISIDAIAVLIMPRDGSFALRAGRTVSMNLRIRLR